ncbi:MAG: class I SAM-dependent methyltransferase [Candidatus Marsarchaeota archaeon]|nr:class I SAM-dependent methyltransferase [Candidatus Marsarchaeota archaeon]
MVTNRTRFYDEHAKYDNLKESNWHKVANPKIDKILKRHNVKTVLDLTCGTGGQVFWLAERGYDVVGSDLSHVSIKFARLKAKKKRMKIKLLVGDMRTQKVGKFDAVITMFNAVGHLSKPGFDKAMRNIRNNLKDNGIYVFDIINSHHISELDSVGDDLDQTTSVDGIMFHKIQLCRTNPNTGIMTMEEVYSSWKDHRNLKIGKLVKWTMQTYSGEQLRKMLSRNGFRVLGQYDLRDGSKFSDKKTRDILTVAQRI